MDAELSLDRRVIDALDDVVFTTDAAGGLTFLSAGWTALTGRLVEESLGTLLVEHVELAATDDLAELDAERRCRTAFGGVRWVRVRTRALPGGGAGGTIADITTGRRERARLEEAESRFRGAFDQAATPMAIVAPDGRPLRVNAALCELVARPDDELLELRLDDLTHPDDVSAQRFQWERLAAGDVRAVDVEVRLVRPDGATVWVRQSAVLVRGDDGRPAYGLCHLHDVTAAHRAAERDARRMLRDGVTGLPTEALFHDRLDQALARTRRSGGRVGVLRCAIGEGDLGEVAQRLAATLRPGDTLARVGDAELGVVLEGLADDTAADAARRRIEEALSGLDVRIGLATAGEDGGLDAAGRLVADAGAGARGPEDVRLAEDLRGALEHHELRLAFQPVVALSDGRLVELEALLRWEDPRAGLRPAEEFLPAAAAAGLLEDFGAWGLREACRALGGWRAAGLGEDVVLAVNLSAAELRRPDLVDVVAEALRDAGLEPAALRLEVREDALGPDAQPALRALARLGVGIVVDDFGAGAASLEHVTRVPALAAVKADRGLVRRAAASREDAAMLAAVISLGRSLGVGVVAEGLESAAEVRLLRNLGCTLGQGFWFGRPLPAAAVEQLLRRAALGELGG